MSKSEEVSPGADEKGHMTKFLKPRISASSALTPQNIKPDTQKVLTYYSELSM